MATRNTFTAMAIDRMVVSLFGKVTFGGSGAVSAVDALGFTVTKPAGTGIYRITLEDFWAKQLGISLIPRVAASDVKWQQQTDHSASSKVIDVQLIGGAVAADAASGTHLYIRLDFLNSTIPRKGA